MRAAIGDGDLPRALGAAFDARCDAEIDSKSVLSAIERKDGAALTSELGFDELLERTGLHELFAARLELACDRLTGRERASVGLALGRLYAGPLGRPDRAVEAWIEALVVDPGNAEAKSLLRNHASTSRDHAPLLEALIRIGETSAGPERNACLRELATLAEERLSDPALASWALARLLESEADDSARKRQAAPRAASAARRARRCARPKPNFRERPTAIASSSWRAWPSLLQGRPDLADRSIAVLRELCRLRACRSRLSERARARLGSQGAARRVGKRSSSDWSERATSAAERARLALVALERASTPRGRRGRAERARAAASTNPARSPRLGASRCCSPRAAARKALHARALLRVAAQLAPAVSRHLEQRRGRRTARLAAISSWRGPRPIKRVMPIRRWRVRLQRAREWACCPPIAGARRPWSGRWA